jgi:formylglycine-generating enzyme required for sulfatase activity
VAEWVEDCWNDNYRGAPSNGSAWTAGQCRLRVLRGGAFDSQSRYLRSMARFRYDVDVRFVANGFRVVRELP